MPILETPKNDDPLAQGDILHGVALYATGNDWAETKGSPELLQTIDLCLVISRPCVLRHKNQIVVAAVKAKVEKVPTEIDTFDKVLTFLNQLRDGHGSPDRFYLGQIPDLPSGRYYSHLDSLHSVAVPEAKELAAYLCSHRVARLSNTFCRDLHVRLFSTFANLGFNDVEWFSDSDLKWLVDLGLGECSRKRTELDGKNADLSSLQASGAAINSKHTESIRTAIVKLSKEVDDIKAKLSPYEEELRRRDVNVG